MSISSRSVRLFCERGSETGCSPAKGVETMIKGLAGASNWSEDLKKNLLPFYRDVLGLTVRVDTPAFVVFGAADAPALALGTHNQVRGRNAEPARHMSGLGSDDVAKDWKRR